MAEGVVLIETELFMRTVMERLHWVGVDSIVCWITGNEGRLYETAFPMYLCLPTTDIIVMIMTFGNKVAFHATIAKHISK